MIAAENEDDPPLTVDLLANLQAGLVDHSTPAPPTDNARHAVHPRYPRKKRARVIAAGAGVSASILAIGIGATALTEPHRFTDAPSINDSLTARHITVSSVSPVFAIPITQILELLNQDPDYGPLSDPIRRASCLSSQGYPSATPLLGARAMEINGHHGVLLVLPGETADKLTVIAVPVTCGPTDTGLLATTVITRR